ncbi:MAG TPA: FKBP-type peptidyl-prolyl cis-trans isomerase [Vicinamibacterales bacterium]|jgi:FKBP-type peptidyl-prolyl cis-trans isomerase
MLVRKLRPTLLFVVLAAVVVTAGCGDSVTAPTNYAAFNSTDLRVGGGTDATVGKVITVKYTGWFYDASATDQKGVQFDSTTGGTPFTFTLGGGQVISGWEQGLPGMKVGGLRRLVIPPSLAYGSTRNGLIPPFTTLLFEIELVEVQQ